MKVSQKILIFILLLITTISKAQHQSDINVKVNFTENLFDVNQKIIFKNTTTDTLYHLILNDWNHAFSSKNSALARRFSDEFVRGFHLSSASEKGHTKINSITNINNEVIDWKRIENQIELIEIPINNGLKPNETFEIQLQYTLKIPSEKFSKYGFNSNGKIEIKSWYIAPARYENHQFVKYSNENIDDIANALTNITLTLQTNEKLQIITDLNLINKSENYFEYQGENRNDIHLVIEKNSTFNKFKNSYIEVETNLSDANLSDIHKAVTIDKIINFVHEMLPGYPHNKIIVSQADYSKNPFYGLNQLPSFLRPFQEEFLYEIKFLKTYLNNYLNNSLSINQRKEYWIKDALQTFYIIKYLEMYHPNQKMIGNVANYKITQGFFASEMNFEDQFSYLYQMMTRKNLDQSLTESKEKLIKFNEQISGKYKAGLALRYLERYIGEQNLQKSIIEFYKINKIKQATENDFLKILSSNTYKKIDWFYNEVINDRKVIDYSFGKITQNKDSISVIIKNNGQAKVPISLFTIKNDTVKFNNWFKNIVSDTVITFKKGLYDKLVLNYDKAIPEDNMRNNWKSLKGFWSNNRPLKLTFFKDFEDPYYNQLFYIPDFRYNYYDGIALGVRFYNKSMLQKPFIFDISPLYATKSQTLVGSFSIGYNQQLRNSRLYNISYTLQGNSYHYAPDARFFKLNPYVVFRIRENDFRDNKKQLIYTRYVLMHREKSLYNIDINQENYGVFNLRYINSTTETTKHFSFTTDVQFSSLFGKASTELEYRKLFDNNRQVNFRLFAGTFLYRNTNSDFFSFTTGRPNDYLFDYAIYGRSESTGIFSRQYISAEGGFKSMLTPFANEWIASTNTSFNIWNWIEVYGDAGFIKNRNESPEFLYDSGIRLNLVTDYFELYFPVYSSNGLEINQPHYSERIRFVLTIAPNTLVNLFTRKWF